MITLYNYSVTFSPTELPPVAFIPLSTGTPPLGPGQSNPVNVTTPLALFAFTLASELEGASFLTSPMQWFTVEPDGSLMPDNWPPDFQVHSYTPTYFSVWDFNSTQSASPHTFFIYVFYEGQIYSGDPVIINQPP